MIRIARLADDPAAPFPAPHRALRDPDGLLAMGGDLSPARLLNAYASGIFPWYSEGQPILWWCPDPRLVFDTATFRLPTRFRRWLRRSTWQVSFDTGFDAVVAACADTPRPGQPGTWLLPEMRAAYGQLHRLGHAHSVEVRDGGRLVGGLYGVAVGRMFFGESMFSGESGGSKVALAALCRSLTGWGWPLLDAQVENPHLLSLGARRMPREQFLAQVALLAAQPGLIGPWNERLAAFPAADLGMP